MNNYPSLPPPPPQGPPGYNPFNPYGGYDPNADYVSWLPGRQSPRFLPIAIVIAAILICSCCSFFTGAILVYELDGGGNPASAAPAQEQPQEEPTPEEPTPESWHWQITYVRSV